MNPIAIAVAAALALATPLRAQLPEPEALARELMRDVEALAHDSMEGRRIGTPGGARAREYLSRALAATGVTRVGDSWTQPFEARRETLALRGANLIGVVRGTARPGRYLVVTAHYDHVGVLRGQVYNGADDNASGTAALLALARAAARRPLAHSVLFVLLDGEEGGLTGARHFVANAPVPLESIVVNVNLDMVGRNDRNELYAAGTSHYPALRPVLDSVASRAPIVLRFGHDRPGIQGEDDWTTQSDHAAFHARGIPFIYFGEEDHPDYHRPTDDAERLMPAFFAGAVATIHDALRALDRRFAAAR